METDSPVVRVSPVMTIIPIVPTITPVGFRDGNTLIIRQFLPNDEVTFAVSLAGRTESNEHRFAIHQNA
jgi:hypothetical protein